MIVGVLLVGLAQGSDGILPEVLLGCDRVWGSATSGCQVPSTPPAPARRVFLSREEARTLIDGDCAVGNTRGQTFAMAMDRVPGPRTVDNVLDFAGVQRGPDGAMRIGGAIPTVRLDGVPVSDEWISNGLLVGLTATGARLQPVAARPFP